MLLWANLTEDEQVEGGSCEMKEQYKEPYKIVEIKQNYSELNTFHLPLVFLETLAQTFNQKCQFHTEKKLVLTKSHFWVFQTILCKPVILTLSKQNCFVKNKEVGEKKKSPFFHLTDINNLPALRKCFDLNATALWKNVGHLQLKSQAVPLASTPSWPAQMGFKPGRPPNTPQKQG